MDDAGEQGRVVLTPGSKTAARPHAVSAHDVARLAGVSQSAVSRAFTDGASISAETRAKVAKAAEQLGYRPNPAARTLITGRSGLIGIVIGSPRNPFYTAALEEMSRRLRAVDKHILLYMSQGDADGDVAVQDLLRYRVDAVLLMSASLSSNLADQCLSEAIKVVFFNRQAGLTDGAASVVGANRAGARQIADHLLDQGYRRLAYMAGFPNSSTSREREGGFVDRLAERGADRPLSAIGHFDRAAAASAARTLLAAPNRPDAIFCANDLMAMATLDVARAEFGLTPGRDLGVAGFDDIESASWPSYDLTSYSQPVAEMCDAALEMLIGEPSAGDHVIVAGALHIRASTRRSGASRP